MNCPQCGVEASSEATFCPQCGHRLREASGAPAKFPTGPKSAASLEAESEAWQGSYSGKAMVGAWVAALVASIGIGVAMVLIPEPTLYLAGGVVIGLIWIVLLLTLAYRKLSIHYKLTSQRFVHRAGILRRLTDRIELIDIDDVSVIQGLIQRMMGVGSIRITSSDRTHPELVLTGIDDVQRVAALIDDLRRAERRKRSVHIEAV